MSTHFFSTLPLDRKVSLSQLFYFIKFRRTRGTKIEMKKKRKEKKIDGFRLTYSFPFLSCSRKKKFLSALFGTIVLMILKIRMTIFSLFPLQIGLTFGWLKFFSLSPCSAYITITALRQFDGFGSGRETLEVEEPSTIYIHNDRQTHKI